MDALADLRRCAALVSAQASNAAQPDFEAALRRLNEAAEQVGRAWCGAWLPGFANLYDAALQPAPGATQAGRCVEWSPAALRDAIHRLAGCPDIPGLLGHAMQVATSFELALCQSRALLSTVAQEREPDARLEALLKAMDRLHLVDPDALIDSWRPSVVLPQHGHSSPVKQRLQQEVPTHMAELAAVRALRSPLAALSALASLLRLAAEHLGSEEAARDFSPPTSAAAACAARSA